MPVYSFHIFNSKGHCLYKKDIMRDTPLLHTHDEQVSSMLKSFQAVANAFAANPGNALLGYRTNKYKAHQLESATGFSFVVFTDTQTTDLRLRLLDYYANVFVEYVMKDPNYVVGSSQPITSTLFIDATDRFIL
eukprot:PhF_6_TR15513/c0_g1_i1/m.24135/K20300/TRAPPC1, BET5; trafficking protein particle complex subunit 1